MTGREKQDDETTTEAPVEAPTQDDGTAGVPDSEPDAPAPESEPGRAPTGDEAPDAVAIEGAGDLGTVTVVEDDDGDPDDPDRR